MEKEQLINLLNEKFPDHEFRDGAFFSSETREAVWTSAETFEQLYYGLPLFNYYNDNTKYTLGVNNHLETFLDKRGWFCEFNDPGTVFIWKM